MAGLGHSREFQVCAKQHTTSFKCELLYDGGEPLEPMGLMNSFKEIPTSAIDETTEKRDEFWLSTYCVSNAVRGDLYRSFYLLLLATLSGRWF